MMELPERYSNYLLRDIIDEFVHSERDRAVLKRKYCDKKTIKELSEEFDVSETTIKNIMYKWDDLVFSILVEKSEMSEI